MEILYLILGLVMGLVIFYVYSSKNSTKKETLVDEEEKQKYERLRNNFNELMGYSLTKAAGRLKDGR
ncbi:hypothetical protein D3C73_1492040 [compost metagenome]